MEEEKFYWLCSNDEEQKIICDTKDNFYESYFKLSKWQSISPWFSSIEELYEQEGILDEPCKICGRLVETHFVEPVKSQLIEKNLCFSCNIWGRERFSNINNKNVYIVNHTYYTDGGYVDRKLNSNGWGLGYGGAIWKIQRLNKTEIITTNNLWCGGDIPKHFWDKLPDNAIFIKENKKSN